MKFNFEKVKSIAKKTAIGAGVMSAAILPLKSTMGAENDNLINKKETPKDKKVNFNEMSTINFNFAQKNYELKNQSFEINKGDMEMIEKIKELEKKFKELSKIEDGETEIAEGSISLLSGGELSNTIELNTGSIYNSPLDNRYITDLVSNEILNIYPNLKLMSKDYFVMKESQSLHDESWVNYKDGGYTKHIMPEYYFIINQNEIDDEVNFEIKIIYTKIKKVDTIKITEKLPHGDDLEIEKFVEGNIVNDLSSAIINKLKELKL